MAFVNNNGIKISYECSDLIAELKQDIEEFGEGKLVNVWCKKDKDGIVLYTNYDFIIDDEPITNDELEDGEYIIKMSMVKLLALLETQNEIF